MPSGKIDSERNRGEIPARFRVSRGTLRLDRFMTLFIRFGGIGVIAAVFGIFVFMLAQILPLFNRATVEEMGRVRIPDTEVAALALDEWSELSTVVGRDGRFHFIDLTGERDTFEWPETIPGLENGFTSVRYNQGSQSFLFGLEDGGIVLVALTYKAVFPDGGSRVIEPELNVIYRGLPGREGYPVRDLAFGQAPGSRLLTVLQEVDDHLELHAVALKQRRTLLGAGKLVVDARFDLTDQLTGTPMVLAVPEQADAIVVGTQEGGVDYFFRSGDVFRIRQTFRPFADLDDQTIAGMEFLLGDVSLVLTNTSGANRVYSLFRPDGSEIRQFGLTKQFPQLPGAPDAFASSLRNKAFLIGSGDTISLCYATTENIRWEAQIDTSIEQVVLGGKYNRILVLGASALSISKQDRAGMGVPGLCPDSPADHVDVLAVGARIRKVGLCHHRARHGRANR